MNPITLHPNSVSLISKCQFRIAFLFFFFIVRKFLNNYMRFRVLAYTSLIRFLIGGGKGVVSSFIQAFPITFLHFVFLRAFED